MDVAAAWHGHLSFPRTTMKEDLLNAHLLSSRSTLQVRVELGNTPSVLSPLYLHSCCARVPSETTRVPTLCLLADLLSSNKHRILDSQLAISKHVANTIVVSIMYITAQDLDRDWCGIDQLDQHDLVKIGLLSVLYPGDEVHVLRRARREHTECLEVSHDVLKLLIIFEGFALPVLTRDQEKLLGGMWSYRERKETTGWPERKSVALGYTCKAIFPLWIAAMLWAVRWIRDWSADMPTS
ncbi:hypothetical protein EDD16DRAFT_1730179 [Pisolithus croceorrhizus]|nr:hypothetical protein EDD16DRAFT_1730179 [Pisolithus croceorrhizus]